MDGIAVAGEVVTAGNALAGLVLIYIGTLVSAFVHTKRKNKGR
jgi:hypothetical protein